MDAYRQRDSRSHLRFRREDLQRRFDSAGRWTAAVDRRGQEGLKLDRDVSFDQVADFSLLREAQRELGIREK